MQPQAMTIWLRCGLAVLLAALAFPALAQEKRVALSFDDVPRQRGAFFTPDERTARLIAALRDAKVAQAAFFVTPGRLDTEDGMGGEARIAAYVAAGHVIANHSFAHKHLSRSTAAEFLADIDKTEAWLKGRPGYRPWFRFPYLDEGAGDKAKRDAVRAGLAARGLRNGYVTADGVDWNIENRTIEARQAGHELDMKALRRLYLQAQISALDYHDALARRTIGRSPAHVLLLHETDLAALFIADLVAELQRHGWSIITVDEAYRDPIGQAQPDVPYSWGTLTGAMAWEKNIDPPLSPIWLNQAMADWIFERRVIVRPTTTEAK